MDDLETLKIKAIKEETKKLGRRLTGLEALHIEQQVEKEFEEKQGKPKKSADDKLPYGMYRFD